MKGGTLFDKISSPERPAFIVAEGEIFGMYLFIDVPGNGYRSGQHGRLTREDRFHAYDFNVIAGLDQKAILLHETGRSEMDFY